MTTFDRYLLGQLVALWGFFSLVLVLVYWVNRAVGLFDRLIAGGHSATVFLEFSMLALPNVIRIVLPISAFAATVYVANRMRGESELIVAETSGISPMRLLRPVAVFGGIAAAVTLVLTLVLGPLAASRLDARSQAIAQDITAGLLTEGEFLHPADGLSLFIREITPANEMHGVLLSDSRTEGQRSLYTAARAVLVASEEGPRLAMFDGLVQDYRPGTGRLGTTRFDEFVYDISSLVGMDSGGRDEDEVPTLELLAASPALQAETGYSVDRLRFAAHERVTQGLAALVTPMVGMAVMLLGGFSRFGAWRQIVGAIVGLIAVDLLDNYVADVVSGRPALWPLAYLPVAMGLSLAGVVAWIAARPRRRPRGRAPA